MKVVRKREGYGEWRRRRRRRRKKKRKRKRRKKSRKKKRRRTFERFKRFTRFKRREAEETWGRETPESAHKNTHQHKCETCTRAPDYQP
jgi:hypothetical protein